MSPRASAPVIIKRRAAGRSDRRESALRDVVTLRNIIRRASTLSAALAVLATGVAWGQRVPCTTVLRELHRAERDGEFRGADARVVAVDLGTTSAWVAKCAAVYGRRLRGTSESAENREFLDSAWESREPDETAQEERETAGEVAVDPAPYRDGARQRAFLRSRKEWAPYEHPGWQPDTGHEWSPYIDDPHRTMDGDGSQRVPRQ